MTTTTKKILLVDDDPYFVESNKELLTIEGYDVIYAHDGAAGLELARKERPDLMILDVMMATDTEGFEVSRAIPQIPELRDLPIILVTGIRKAMNLPFGFEPDQTWLPVKSILEKPVAPTKLLAEIKKRLKD